MGLNREKWVLNPGATSDLYLEMFAFFGKLMGVAMRSKEYLALNIPSFIWKLLVQDTPTRDDLEGIDVFQVGQLYPFPAGLGKLRQSALQMITGAKLPPIVFCQGTVRPSEFRPLKAFARMRTRLIATLDVVDEILITAL